MALEDSPKRTILSFHKDVHALTDLVSTGVGASSLHVSLANHQKQIILMLECG